MFRKEIVLGKLLCKTYNFIWFWVYKLIHNCFRKVQKTLWQQFPLLEHQQVHRKNESYALSLFSVPTGNANPLFHHIPRSYWSNRKNRRFDCKLWWSDCDWWTNRNRRTNGEGTASAVFARATEIRHGSATLRTLQSLMNYHPVITRTHRDMREHIQEVSHSAKSC